MRFFGVLCLLAVACTAWASPPQRYPLARQRRDLGADVIENTGKLIQALVADLRTAADHAREALVKFNNGLLEQGKKVQEKIAADLQKLRDRVSESLKKLQDQFANSGSGVRECVDTLSSKAETIFNTAQEETKSCAKDKFSEASELMKSLGDIGNEGNNLAAKAQTEMNDCTKSSANILATAACLGSVAVRTEVKAAHFLMQSGLAIGRANLKMATLPASLEVCAGSSLVNAGIATGKTLMEIGNCSSHAILSNFGMGSSKNTPFVSASYTFP